MISLIRISRLKTFGRLFMSKTPKYAVHTGQLRISNEHRRNQSVRPEQPLRQTSSVRLNLCSPWLVCNQDLQYKCIVYLRPNISNEEPHLTELDIDHSAHGWEVLYKSNKETCFMDRRTIYPKQKRNRKRESDREGEKETERKRERHRNKERHLQTAKLLRPCRRQAPTQSWQNWPHTPHIYTLYLIPYHARSLWPCRQSWRPRKRESVWERERERER